MQLFHTTLHVGADAPFRAIHVSDTHLTRADERDGARKVTPVDMFPRTGHVESVVCLTRK